MKKTPLIMFILENLFVANLATGTADRPAGRSDVNNASIILPGSIIISDGIVNTFSYDNSVSDYQNTSLVFFKIFSFLLKSKNSLKSKISIKTIRKKLTKAFLVREL